MNVAKSFNLIDMGTCIFLGIADGVLGVWGIEHNPIPFFAVLALTVIAVELLTIISLKRIKESD